MPGYFVHIASAPEDVRSSSIGLKGLIAPDLWKKHTPTETEYNQFFENCSEKPTYEQVKFLCSVEHGGTHFGPNPSYTNLADFALLANLFATAQLDNNLFFKGYIHHLMVDKSFYADPSICDGVTFETDLATNKENAMKDLHLDWDKTNSAIAEWYPEVVDVVASMPKEIQKVIGFAEGPTKYVALAPMRQFMQNMRKSRSMEELLEG